MLSKPKRNPDVETRFLPDGHVVLFSRKTNWAHTLTPLAAIAWEFCDGETAMDEIIVNVCSTAEASDANTKVQLVELIAELEQNGLLDEKNL